MYLTLDQKIEVLDFLYPNVTRIISNNETLEWSIDNPAPMTEAEMIDAYPGVRLSIVKRNKLLEIDQVREERLRLGMQHDFGGQIDMVQTRDEDKFNLLAIALKSVIMSSPLGAELLQNMEGIPTSITFRAESNNEYQLTPAEALLISVKGFLHLENVYKRSWVLKDLVKNSHNVEFIKTIHWDMSLENL